MQYLRISQGIIMGKKVIIAGATGMVGGIVQELCLASQEVDQVVSIVRRPSGAQDDKLKELIVPNLLEFETEVADMQEVDTVFFCIGVYTGAVSRERFREITVDMPVVLAKKIHEHSPNAVYCLLSGAGADRTEKSRLMFAKDKGVAENQLAAIGFGAFHTFRPAYIYPVTPRKEPNLSYRVSRFLYPLIRLVGPNGSIKSTELAQGMFEVGVSGAAAEEVLENRDILALLNPS